MIIAISGTPGTGKTTVAKLLAKSLKANLVSIPALVRQKKIKYSYDSKRKTKVVSEKDLRKAVLPSVVKGKINVVEGHLAHLVKSDIVFILRCNPDELTRRMKSKGWVGAKIKENVEAELLDVITTEAVSIHKKNSVVEIDTSSTTPRQAALLIAKLAENKSLRRKYAAGKIDWTERYRKYFSPRPWHSL